MILVQPQQTILEEHPEEFFGDSYVCISGILVSRGDIKLKKQSAKSPAFGIIGISSSLILLGTYTNTKQAQEVVGKLMEQLEVDEDVNEQDIGLYTPVFVMPNDEYENKEYKIIDDNYSLKITID